MIGVLRGDYNPRRVALVLVEHVLIILSLMVAAVARLGMPEAPITVATNVFWRAELVAAVLQLSLHYCPRPAFVLHAASRSMRKQ